MEELQLAASPQISPNDLIVLSGLEEFALGYELPDNKGQKKSKKQKIITIDTRPHEEYPFIAGGGVRGVTTRVLLSNAEWVCQIREVIALVRVHLVRVHLVRVLE